MSVSVTVFALRGRPRRSSSCGSTTSAASPVELLGGEPLDERNDSSREPLGRRSAPLDESVDRLFEVGQRDAQSNHVSSAVRAHATSGHENALKTTCSKRANRPRATE